MEKTIVITGASGSMGSAAVKALAKKGFGVIMACRNLSKASAVREDILREVPQAKLELAELRLDSFASIREFARSLNDRKLYGLFNNAGVMPKDYTLTGDGYEQTIAVNYLGPFLLTHLLFPNLEGDGHVVNMVSLTCNHVKEPSDFINVRPEDYHQLHNYAVSKLAFQHRTCPSRARFERECGGPGCGEQQYDRSWPVVRPDSRCRIQTSVQDSGGGCSSGSQRHAFRQEHAAFQR